MSKTKPNPKTDEAVEWLRAWRSAEDLVVMKAFASRPKDWVDVEGILIRQHGRLDWAYVEAQLGPLVELKEEPVILARLASMREQV